MIFDKDVLFDEWISAEMCIETPRLSKWTCIYAFSVATLCQVRFCSLKDLDDSKGCLWRFQFELEITFDLFYLFFLYELH